MNAIKEAGPRAALGARGEAEGAGPARAARHRQPPQAVRVRMAMAAYIADDLIARKRSDSPPSALTLQGLADRYGVSLTPVAF